ncbi:MAG: 50S ribosome-binding GTPase [Phycisphaeraceae bacterium]|nr:50S ribosome-binding GTPase [Phycisphaeraceae bacterium]MCW5762041.1 50S ribosome-binding GTPase [Phycisphaeraceae bacterium]
MFTGDTIVARASAAGIGRRAIVRLAGPATPVALRAIGIDDPGRRGAWRVRARCDALPDLPMLLVRYVAPASYTGEEAAELVLVNSDTLIERLMTVLSTVQGVRHAEPGEFTARAYLAGRLTLAQAEGVAAKVAAQTSEHVAAAERVLSGRAGEEYRLWADEIASLLALVESGIDFAEEEDVVAIGAGALRERLEALAGTIEVATGSVAPEPWNGPEPLVVIVGKPNAGKSSLFNALLGHTRVVASPISGTTRDVIVERWVLDAQHAVLLADLPGLDLDACDDLSLAAQAGARRAIEHADLLIACDPEGAFDWIDPTWPERVRVRTKVDSHVIFSPEILSVCSLDGWHLERLTHKIALCAHGSVRAADSTLIPRHREVARRAHSSLLAAAGVLQDQPEHGLTNADLVASSLRRALDLIGELAGRITPDDVIGRIFAQFCIGK